MIHLTGFFRGGNNDQSRIRQKFYGIPQPGCPAYREAMERPCRGFHCIGIDHGRTLVGHQQGMHSGTFGRAGNGPEISYIGNLIKYKNKWGITPFIDHGNEFLNSPVFNLGKKSKHTLVVLSCHLVDLFRGNELERYPPKPDHFQKLHKQLSLQTHPEQAFFHLLPRADGFHHSPDAKHKPALLLHDVCLFQVLNIKNPS